MRVAKKNVNVVWATACVFHWRSGIELLIGNEVAM